MNRLIFAALLLSGLGIQANAADLTLKRVMLSSGGIGYFEYAADVEGDAGVSRKRFQRLHDRRVVGIERAAAIADAAWVLLASTRVTASATRPPRAQVSAIVARTTPRRSAI